MKTVSSGHMFSLAPVVYYQCILRSFCKPAESLAPLLQPHPLLPLWTPLPHLPRPLQTHVMQDSLASPCYTQHCPFASWLERSLALPCCILPSSSCAGASSEWSVAAVAQCRRSEFPLCMCQGVFEANTRVSCRGPHLKFPLHHHRVSSFLSSRLQGA